MTELHILDETEQFALAGLIYAVATADRSFSRDEAQAVAEVASQIGSPSPDSSPYRSDSGPEPLEAADLFAMIEQAAEERESGEWLETAILMVDRPEARVSIYSLLYQLAAAEMVNPPEQSILDRLKEAWELP